MISDHPVQQLSGIVAQILNYSEIDRQQWSALVRTSETGTWFQSPEAYDFYASMPELFKPFAIGIEASPQPSPEGKGDGPTQEPLHDSFASVWGSHTADSTQYNLLKANAIANRKMPTEAESVMWDLLKGNNLGLHFRRQHIILDYIVDFICLDKGLVVELDGGYHLEPEQKEYDEQRTAHLQKLGYTELRFTNEELFVNPDEVIAKINAVADNLPSLKGRIEERPVLRGIAVGYITVEKNAFKQFLTRRAIIIGGPCLADDCTDEEVAALMKAVKSTLLLGRDGVGSSPIYIETRNYNDFSPWKEPFETAGFAYKKHLNFHFDCTDREAMWARLSETRRRQIHKAQKNGAIIEEARTEQEIADWYAILTDLYRLKVKTPLFPLSFFLAFFRQKRGIYLLVKADGKVIGGIMCPIKEEQCIYEWFVCGMDNSYKSLSPSVMATWAAMEYAYSHQLARFDIMGAGEPGVPYGVRDFKAEFGGQLVEHGRFIHICKPCLYRLGTWGVKILKNR